MSNVQIPNLTTATALNGTEQLEAVQSGSSVRVTSAQIAALNTNTGTVTSITTVYPITGGTITTTGNLALASQGVSNSYLSLMPAYTIKGNPDAASAPPQDMTSTQVLGLLGIGGIANNTLLGNISGSAANPTAVTLTSYIDSAIGNTQGSLLYRSGTGWSALAPDTAGRILSTNGLGADPSWIAVAGTGTVTEVTAGTGLSGGTITTTGTLSITNTGVSAASYGSASSVPTYTVNAQGQLTAASNVSIAVDASAITTGVLPIARGGTALSSTPTNGQLMIGNGTGYTLGTISAGTGITVTNSVGGISLSMPNTAVSAGAYGSSSSVGTFTVDAQGRLTAAASVPINAVALTTGTISTAPTADTDIANKLYVDSIAQGLNFHAACNYATTSANDYTVTYNNGTSGVGATLTNAGTLAAFAVDGATLTSGNIGNRILIKNQTNAAYNGVYTLTTVGSGSVAWVLTRATDFDSSGTGVGQIDAGDFMLVLSGTANANTSWVQQTPLPIVVGTTGITFTQFGATTAYTAGTGLTLAGNAFSITSTGVTANSYGSASSVPTYTVNAQGQLTAAASTSIAIDATAVTSGILPVARGGTGVVTSTGSGSTVLSTSPTLVTPVLGTPTSATLTNATGLPLTSGVTGTLPIANGGTNATTAAGALTSLGALPLAGGTMTGGLTGTTVTMSSGGATTAATFTSASVGTGGTIAVNDTGTNGSIIKMTGNGATTPSKFLNVLSGVFRIVNNAYSAALMTVDDSGNVVATANVTAYSDERVKTNWRSMDAGFLKQLSEIKAGTYDRTDTPEPLVQVGVSAQDLQKILGPAVLEDADGRLSVAYGNAALVAAVELCKEVQRLHAEIEALKTQFHDEIGTIKAEFSEEIAALKARPVCKCAS